MMGSTYQNDDPPPLYRPPSPAPTYYTVDIRDTQHEYRPHNAAVSAREDASESSVSQTAELFIHIIKSHDKRGLLHLLQDGHDANTILDHRAQTRPLHLAAMITTGEAGMIDLLLQHGANLALANSDGYAPVHLAAQHNNAAAINRLVQCGADPNSTTTYSSLTGLQIAAEFGHLAAVNTLLTLGASINPQRQRHWNSATATKHTTSPLYIAASNSHLDIVTALLNAGAQPWSPDKHGRTLLHHAARNAWAPLAEYLLDGTKPHHAPSTLSIIASDKSGATPLHAAAHGGDVAILTALLALDAVRARINAPMDSTSGGYTPLHIAASANHALAVKLLLYHGADVGARTDERMTALHLAVAAGGGARAGGGGGPDPDRELLGALVDAGVDLDAVERGGRTAADLALELERPGVAVWLGERGAAGSAGMRTAKQFR